MKRLLTLLWAVLFAAVSSPILSFQTEQVVSYDAMQYNDVPTIEYEQQFIRGPPEWLADSGAMPPYTSYPGIGCQPFNLYSNSGIYSRATCSGILGMWNDLQTSLVPDYARGSGTPTFTRATTAYQQDFEGKQNLVLSGEVRFNGSRRVHNRFLSTGDLTAVSWVLANSVSGDPVRTGSQTDPNGGTTAIKLVYPAVSGAGDYSLLYQAYVNASVQSASMGFSLKGDAGGEVISISRTTDGISYTTATVTLTTSWKRFVLAGTFAAGTTQYIQIGTDLRDGSQTAKGAQTIYVSFPQLEFVTGQANQNPSEYVPALATANVDSNAIGVRYFSTLNGNTVASNVVTEATGAAIVTGASGVAATAPVDAGGPFGYLAEGARADVLGTTAAIRRTMTDVGWVVGATMTVGAATGVDGVASAGASLTGGAVTATNTILFTTVLGSAARTYGAWVRRKTGTGTIEMTDDGGTHWTAIVPTANYALYQVTRTQANPIVGFRITTNTDAIEVDFNTLEAAAFANPTPIPVNVSKAADVLSYPLANNASFTQGSLYAEAASGGWSDNVGDIIYIGDGGLSSDITGSTLPEPHLNIWDGTNETEVGPFLVTGVMQKVGGTWGGAVMTTALSGVVVSGDFDGALGTGTAIYIGTEATPGFEWYGPIRNARIWLTALPESQMATRTAFNEAFMPNRVAWAEAANDDEYLKRANQ